MDCSRNFGFYVFDGWRDETYATQRERAKKMAWVEDFSQGQIRGISTLEILGALGMILPGITGILPILTPLAALGLVLTMSGAFLTHLRRKELVPMGIMNLMLMAMALFVAFGRFLVFPPQ